ncbi:MAG TPA: OadG-related small transporter subunit [Tepiditoga sp.]|nr:OadG-related small transporter subunit [Tepiditoga sp.]
MTEGLKKAFELLILGYPTTFLVMFLFYIIIKLMTKKSGKK